ncbi:DUF2058 family protein [Luteibacter sp. PPL201]|jgi:uncharacterized protein YaiL (DUF2058 family)|uniref:DUF2058 family protein n=1 Tax=Luteibacter sahnii TaxID=3021977 RepID=A0ABT6B8N4_9GAMM|nr:DUF2058 family protein [Luteibacter sp. PPL193]MDY1549381.1 DUF2058 family protein [Luteibacter sp. PPL193]
MAESLRDQLLKSGLVKEIREEKRTSPPPKQGGFSGQPYAGKQPRHGGGKPHGGRPGQGGGGSKPQGGQRPPRKDGEIDLAKAYAIRAQAEATERRRAEAEAAEQARLRKEKKRKVEDLLKGKALNLAEAEHVRHFPYGDKIRRVHVDTAQLAAINAGELGVVQQGGRYLVVDKVVIDELRGIAPEFIALMVDPNAPDASDDGVPDDLIW